MIDAIWVQPAVHIWVGIAVLASTFLSVVAALVVAIRKQGLSRLIYATFLLAQATLMIQVLIGIKLLDQGLGPLQLYIHYLGGLGAFFFYVLFYWLPVRLRERRWTAVVLSSSSFLFALMAYTIGSSYVAGHS